MALAQQQNYQHKLDELKRGYRPEEIASAEAHYRETQATLEKFERGNRREDVDLAKAAYAYDEARFRERQVTAPSAAIVEVLDVRPGDIIAPNTPIATLLEQDQIYVRIYIPETELGRVQVGQKAEVRVDSFPKTVFDGSRGADQSASGISSAQRADARGTRSSGIRSENPHQRSRGTRTGGHGRGCETESGKLVRGNRSAESRRTGNLRRTPGAPFRRSYGRQ